jgi:hypothetical protein
MSEVPVDHLPVKHPGSIMEINRLIPGRGPGRARENKGLQIQKQYATQDGTWHKPFALSLLAGDRGGRVRRFALFARGIFFNVHE